MNPDRVSQVGFLLGGLVAGVAGFAVGPLVSTSVTVGLSYSIKGFVALAAGGFGKMRAGMVARARGPLWSDGAGELRQIASAGPVSGESPDRSSIGADSFER